MDTESDLLCVTQWAIRWHKVLDRPRLFDAAGSTGVFLLVKHRAAVSQKRHLLQSVFLHRGGRGSDDAGPAPP